MWLVRSEGLEPPFHKYRMFCINCNIETPNPKFCSSSCSARYNNSKRVRTEESKRRTSQTIKAGLASGKITPGVPPSRKGKRYRVEQEDFMDYKTYRRAARFRISDFTNIQGYSLVESHGWYDTTDTSMASKDHMFSVKDGWLNKISPELIAHPANCQIIPFKENRNKSDQSCITLAELYDRIKNWWPHQDSNPEPWG